MIQTFNVRVYGIWKTLQNQVLVVEEIIKGDKVIKFPGGGLEFGEGILDCLKREWKEETGLEITNAQHFYTTEHFVPSAYNPNHQVISVYYLLCSEENKNIEPRAGENEIQGFHFLPMEHLHESLFFYPIDKLVVNMLKKL